MYAGSKNKLVKTLNLTKVEHHSAPVPLLHTVEFIYCNPSLLLNDLYLCLLSPTPNCSIMVCV